MHLKRLKLRSFKSFAGSSEIPFQPGFTGVAGPNGMGKSNISDAILFVLGPTSSKALRADRLTHLFFNGGASKKPSTECEVSLVFDNNDRLLPVDGAEVEITRYVKLAPSDPNGYYSYFYVNGRRSTQTEIDSILSHARLSGDGYNLVQQGDVNRIVGMGTVPRRQLVERLAGIAQYDDELARADGKRQELEQNLAQIQALLGEVRSRLEGLESQRLQAIQYKQLLDEKRRAEARIARTQYTLQVKEVESSETQLARLRDEMGRLTQEAEALEGERQRVEGAITKIDQEADERAGIAGQKFKQDLDQKRIDFARLDDKLGSLREELARAREAMSSQAEEAERTHKEVERLDIREKELAAQLASVDEEYQRISKEINSVTAESEKPGGKLAQTRRQVLDIDRRRKAAEAAWQGALKALETAKAGLASAETEQAKAEDEVKTRNLELRDAELRAKESAAASSKSRSISDLQKEFHDLKGREKALSEDAAKLQQEVNELNRQYLALDARLKARLEGGKGGSTLGVDFILAQRTLGRIDGIRGTVEELAEIDPEHKVALSVAAGGRFQALVVETDRVAEECIQLLRKEGRGRATFLPLNKMLEGRPHGKALVVARGAGSLGFALDLVRFPEELRPALWYVFGETVVMDNLSNARTQMGGVRLVTLQGDLIEATGAMTGGSVELGRSRAAEGIQELKRLGEALRTKSGAEADARKQLEQVTERLRTVGEELGRRSGEAAAQDSAREVFERELASQRERAKEALARLGRARKEREQAEKTLEWSTAEEGHRAKTLADVTTEAEKLQSQFLEQIPTSVAFKIRQLNEGLHAVGERRTAITGEVQGTRGSLSAAREQADAKQNALVAIQNEIPEREKAIRSMESDLERAREALDTLKAVELRHLEAMRGQEEKRRSLERLHLKTIDKIARSQENRTSRETMAHEQEVRLATARQKLAEMEEALRAFPEAEKGEKALPLEEIRRLVQSVQTQLAAMGDVNQRAVEEYDQEKGRLEEFEAQVNRLNDEKAELQTLVGEIEKKKRTRLVEVIAKVDENFREIYSELAPGGEGEIALENPDDPLAGGLLIKARPVGKRVQRLEQLSGGEKSLASLGFIFALQRYDPSPLYVFDEVDMSLDSVNAENVGRMLRRNAERAQFIVISLRKVTLKFAQRLFGVTMRGEDGCSRVVSLGLDEIIDVDEKDRLGVPSPAVEVS